LYTLKVLADHVSPPNMVEKILPVILAMTKDLVPNVRFVSAKILTEMLPKFDTATISKKIKPELSRLHEDVDVDVKFFAAQALTKC